MSDHNSLAIPHVHPLLAWGMFLVSLALHGLDRESISIGGQALIWAVQILTGCFAIVASYHAIQYYRIQTQILKDKKEIHK